MTTTFKLPRVMTDAKGCKEMMVYRHIYIYIYIYNYIYIYMYIY